MVNSRQQLHKGSAYGNSLQAQRAGSHGGTIINVITALIFFGLIALGIWWIIKSIGQTGQQYTEAMIKTRYTAMTVKCQTNLRAIGQNIQMYAISNERFPPSLEALIEWRRKNKKEIG